MKLCLTVCRQNRWKLDGRSAYLIAVLRLFYTRHPVNDYFSFLQGETSFPHSPIATWGVGLSCSLLRSWLQKRWPKIEPLRRVATFITCRWISYPSYIFLSMKNLLFSPALFSLIRNFCLQMDTNAHRKRNKHDDYNLPCYSLFLLKLPL